MMNRIKTYIENEPWEAKIPAWERRGNAIGYALLIFAALYFGAGALCILLR